MRQQSLRNQTDSVAQLRIEFAEQFAARQARGATIMVRNSLRRPLKGIGHHVCYNERTRLPQGVQSKTSLK